MKTQIYREIPDAAKEIRSTVFVCEQGFCEEFDTIDETAVHFVVFEDENLPVATCRVFWDAEQNAFVLGRLAVRKAYRGRQIGSVLVLEAEKYVRQNGGTRILLHAQCRAGSFYQKLGFSAFGDPDDEEGCPHIWMQKTLSPCLPK